MYGYEPSVSDVSKPEKQIYKKCLATVCSWISGPWNMATGCPEMSVRNQCRVIAQKSADLTRKFVIQKYLHYALNLMKIMQV